ncbi:MAG: HNH endonuclease [bacterium]|nr:HNH endonuclease [bacterium]
MWELFPTIDHVVPVALGGHDEDDNFVTTSMMRNQIKAQWTLEEMGWVLHPPRTISDWDGLMGWFVDYVAAHPLLLETPYIKRWHRLAEQLGGLL